MVNGTIDGPSFLSRNPEMQTYGDLFRQMPSMRPSFERAQDGAAAHVFRALYPFVNQGLIDRIVDLGCGNGVILRKLQDLFAKTLEGSPTQPAKPWLKLVGIDSDVSLIGHLKHGTSRGVSLEFALADAVGLTVNKTDKTALLVLGHTIFHFARSPESLEQFLRKLTPVLWVIDCHRTWNDAVFHATASDRKVYLEPVWEEKPGGPIICLQTVAVDGGVCVRRGLVRRADSPDESSQVMFETIQVAINSEELKKMLEELGYFVSLSYEYYSSWGPMSSTVFVRDLTTDAKDANDSWYTAVSSALSEIFRPSPVPSLENQFVAVRKAIKLYKVRCAAVILPFDRIHTFARYAPLDRGTIDNLDSTAMIWRGDQPRVMVLEEPSQDQDKYPTAYGLFTCILGRTSSIQVFPLRLIANYQMAQVDRDFTDYEFCFFASCTTDGTLESDRAFFLLPVFFGRLPLFVLVLQFGDTFSELDTGPGLFRSCLLDLHQQLGEVIDERFLRVRILRPFLRDAYNQLRSSGSESSRGQLSPREISDQVYKDLETMVLKNAIEKPWKSWVLALPGTEIKLKRTVIAEQINLERIVRAEIKRLRHDIFFRLSRELEEVGFFAADREESIAESVDDPHKRPGLKHHRIILLHGLANEARLSELVDLDSRYQDVIAWSAGKMSLLIRTGQESQSGNAEAFQDLKAVYCRALENTGGPFRFSARRLECMVEIATGVRVEASVAPGCSIVRPIEEDPCQGLFEILHDLKAYWNQCLPAVSIKVENRPTVDGITPRGLAAEVLVDFSSALADGGMGQDSRHLLETLGRWCSTGTPLTEPDKTRLLIARMEVGPGVGGAAVWRSLRTELIVQELT